MRRLFPGLLLLVLCGCRTDTPAERLYLRVEYDREREPAPAEVAAQPENRVPVTIDPDTAYARLLSDDKEVRNAAMTGLGLPADAERRPSDVRLMAVNLDSDDDLERILILEIQTSGRYAGVFKRVDGKWWSLGGFLCGVTRGRCQQRFFELHHLVWYGTNDIVMRRGGSSGPGIGGGALTIYRVFNGRLYKVFEAEEWSYDMAESMTSEIDLPDAGDRAGGPVTVRRTHLRDGRPVKTACESYPWDPRAFRYSPAPGACQ